MLSEIKKNLQGINSRIDESKILNIRRKIIQSVLGTILPGIRSCNPANRQKGPTVRGPWDHNLLRRQNLSSRQRLYPFTSPCLAPGRRLISQ